MSRSPVPWSSYCSVAAMNGRAQGFTLVELLLSLAISSTVGLLVVMMLGAVGAAARSEHDIRHALIKRQIATVRLNSALRSSVAALATDPHSVLLWKGDSNGNLQPDLSEVRYLQWSPTTRELRWYESPVDLSPAADEPLEVDAQLLAFMSAERDTTRFPGRTAITQVSAWRLTADDTDPRRARILLMQMTVNTESGDDEVTVVSALRGTVN